MLSRIQSKSFHKPMWNKNVDEIGKTKATLILQIAESSLVVILELLLFAEKREIYGLENRISRLRSLQRRFEKIGVETPEFQFLNHFSEEGIFDETEIQKVYDMYYNFEDEIESLRDRIHARWYGYIH